MPPEDRHASTDLPDAGDRKDSVVTIGRQQRRADFVQQPQYLPIRRLPSANDFQVWTVEAIQYSHAHESWFTHLPSRLGSSPVIDACTRALVTASYYRRPSSDVTLRSCYETLDKAFQAVRLFLDHFDYAEHVDDLLACIAMLAIHDGVVGTHNSVTWSHFNGFETVLSNRPDGSPITEFTCRVLEYHCCDAAVYACVRGIASPLEAVFRTSPDIWVTGTGKRAQTSLRRLGHILSITVPRLVALTREAAAFSQPSLEKALALAAELYRLTDIEAENIVLHAITVRPKSLQTPETRGSVTFRYGSILDFECTVCYWQARSALLRLCHRLPRFYLIPPSDIMSAPLPKYDTIQRELRRLSHNLLMSSEYALSLRNLARKRLFAHAMITVWGALHDFSGMIEKEDDIRTEVLGNVNAALTPAAPLLQYDMDEAAEIFVGGPILGHYARLYGLPQT